MNEQQKMDQGRADFEAYMLGREHPVIGWIDSHWFGRGDDTASYANDYVQGCWVMWQARASLPLGVPDGWKLVPVEPTPEMIRAGDESWCSSWPESAGTYTAMLAAAPAAQPAAECICGGGEFSGHTAECQYQHFLAYSCLQEDAMTRYAFIKGLGGDCEKPAAEQSAPGEEPHCPPGHELVALPIDRDDRKYAPCQTVKEAMTMLDFGLAFALCNRDHAGTRRDVKKAQSNFKELERLLDARDAGVVRVPVATLRGLVIAERDSLHGQFEERMDELRALLAQREQRGGE